ncbi:MAG: 3-dehydroquinate synthase [Alphaproteobacteria bacterium]
MPDSTVTVDTGRESYDITIGEGLLADAGTRLQKVLPAGAKICVVTDDNVAKLYLMPLMKALEAAGFHAMPPVILHPGEETKNFERLQYIIEKCLSYKLDRKSAIIALGGGVVGDIAGFAASILLRGVPFVQVPTTLLAQVDSSVGGKTAINTSHGKNLVGSFYQPRAVLIDTSTLKTLPAREVKAGYAEIVKYALIDDPALFTWLEQNGDRMMAGEGAALIHAVKASCAAKARIVAADEKETKDIRALLNLGHTFGHALEAIYNYDGRLLHGEAVGIGIKMAYGFSAALGLCAHVDSDKVVQHLKARGLMVAPPSSVKAGDMLERMKADKKASGGRMTLVLARGIGQSFVAKDVAEEKLKSFLEKECA